MSLTLNQLKEKNYLQPPLEVICGDNLSISYTLHGVEDADVAAAFFVCKGLDTKVELTDNGNNLWGLILPSSTTAEWKPGMHKYDLEIVFTNGEKQTVCYNSPLLVLSRGE